MEQAVYGKSGPELRFDQLQHKIDDLTFKFVTDIHRLDSQIETNRTKADNDWFIME